MSLLHLATGRPPFLDGLLHQLARQGRPGELVVIPGTRRQRSTGDYAKGRLALGRHLRRGGGVDLLHAHYGTCAALAATQRRVPFVASFWGSDVYGGTGAAARAVAAASRWAARRADAVIVRNREMAARLGVPCFILASGVDLDRIRPTPRDEARATLGLGPERRLVLWPYDPARPEKDYGLAAATLALVRRRVPDAELLVVHGRPHPELMLHLCASDALLLTSRHEGSPNSVREAMAANVPVVSTRVADVPDLLAGVQASALGTTAEELAAGLVPLLLEPRRSDGRQFPRRLDAAHFAACTARIYDQVLAGAVDPSEPGLHGWLPQPGNRSS